MTAQKSFLVEIVTPERKVFSDMAEFAVFPGADGEFGVLPDHAPLLSALKPGEIKVTRSAKSRYFAVSDGFLEVRANKVTVIAETCEAAGEIDKERALRARKAGLEELPNKTGKQERLRIEFDIRKAEVRLKVAEKADVSGPQGPH